MAVKARKARKKVRKKKVRKKARRKKLPGKIVGEINGFPVRRLLVKQLQAADYNPRTITDDALNGLKRSIGEFGLPQAIIWNKRTQNVVGGHQRLQTLDPDGPTEVIEVDLDEPREKALNLALNSPHISGEFTVELSDLLAEMSVALPDLSADLRLSELYNYVPVMSDLDELLLDERGVERGGNSGDGIEKNVGDKAEGFVSSDLRQIILIFSPEEDQEAREKLSEVMKKENCPSITAAVVHLMRQYGN